MVLYLIQGWLRLSLFGIESYWLLMCCLAHTGWYWTDILFLIKCISDAQMQYSSHHKVFILLVSKGADTYHLLDLIEMLRKSLSTHLYIELGQLYRKVYNTAGQ